MTNLRPRTPLEYVQALWRRKLLFFLVAATMLASTFIVIRNLPNTYQAKASVVIAGKQEDRQVMGGRVATITERLTSRSLLEPLIQKHDLYPAMVGAEGIEPAVARLRNDIKVEIKYRGDVAEKLNITYRNNDPVKANQVATDLLATVGKMNEAMLQTAVEESATIQSEMEQIENRLDELNQRRASAVARSRAVSYRRSAASMIRAQREAASSSAQALQDKRYLIEQQIAQQKRQIAEQEKIVASAPPDTRSASSYGVLLVKKAEVEAQVKDYSSQYTDKNPKLAQSRTQLEEINRQIAEFEAGRGTSQNSNEVRELRALQRDLARMEAELEINQRESVRKQETLSSTPNVGPASASIPSDDSAIANISTETDENRLRDRYNSLIRRKDTLDNTKLATAGLEPGLFQIVDMPTVPEQPVGPNRTQLLMMALALALGAGLLAAASVEAPKFLKIHDQRDVQYYLNAPVIALIPETVTPAERGRRMKVHLVRWVAVAVIAVASVPALVFLLNQLKVFQMFANRW